MCCLKTALITGVSSGLGYALASLYLNKGYQVIGIGRSRPSIDSSSFFFYSIDLSDLTQIQTSFKPILETRDSIDICYLNAGILGKIDSMLELTQDDIEKVMNINVWANKEILDALVQFKNIKTIIAISSGASVNGSYGWGGYSLSKASLNMLMKLYAKEMPQSLLFSIAPGVIDTPMVQTIINNVDEELFPSAKTLKNGTIQTPQIAAKRLFHFSQNAKKEDSGEFLDIRDFPLTDESRGTTNV